MIAVNRRLYYWFLMDKNPPASSASVKSVQRLPARPVLADVHHFLSQAMQQRGTKINVCWSAPNSQTEFVLSILCNRIGGDPEWRMYAGTGNLEPRLLWFYVSNDLLLVYNLVVSSCGEAGKSENGSRAEEADAQQVTTSKHDAYPTLQNKSSTPSSRVSKSLQGDLSLVHITNLLQSILMAKMNGRLSIDGEKKGPISEIFFIDGVAVHARAGAARGSEAMLDIMSCKEGTFQFHPKVTTEERTVDRTLDVLLLQGVTLVDDYHFLKNAGLMQHTVLIRKHSNVSEQDFETLLSASSPADMATQKKFYQSIDGRRSVMEIVSFLELARSAWVPAVSNLIRADLIAINVKTEGGGTAKPLTLEPKRIDKSAIESVMISLRRPQTGMFTYPAFLYFLEQEYFRRYRTETPVSILVFELRINKQGVVAKREPLPLPAVQEAVRRISKAKRPIDLLCHYETFDYAMLLPNTRTAGAAVFANRLLKTLTSGPMPGVDAAIMTIHVGVACMPEDFLDPPLLLSAAEVARDRARMTNSPVVLYRDLC